MVDGLFDDNVYATFWSVAIGTINTVIWNFKGIRIVKENFGVAGYIDIMDVKEMDDFIILVANETSVPIQDS